MHKICKIFLICLLFLGMNGCANQAYVSAQTHKLPDYNIPAYTIPKTVHHETDKVIFTNYNTTFSWEVSDGTTCSVAVTLPALNPVAEFAEEYNATISHYADDLLAYIEEMSRNALLPNTTSVSYEAYQNGDLLSVLITEQFASGEAAYQVATFDLGTQKQLTTPELASRLLGLDYPSFLLASNMLVSRDFSGRYGDTVTDEIAGTYNGILNMIPLDTYNLYNRHIFQDDEGNIMLLYQRVLMSEKWQYGLDSTECVSVMDLEVAGWRSVDKVTAMNDLLTLEISDHRYYPEYYSYLLQDTFLNTPEAFIKQLSLLDEERIACIIDYLYYAAWDDVMLDIGEVCMEILSKDSLRLGEKETAQQIYDRATENKES